MGLEYKKGSLPPVNPEVAKLASFAQVTAEIFKSARQPHSIPPQQRMTAYVSYLANWSNQTGIKLEKEVVDEFIKELVPVVLRSSRVQ
jgi:hypothetical protein